MKKLNNLLTLLNRRTSKKYSFSYDIFGIYVHIIVNKVYKSNGGIKI